MSTREAILMARYQDAKRKGDRINMMLSLREIVALKARENAKGGLRK